MYGIICTSNKRSQYGIQTSIHNFENTVHFVSEITEITTLLKLSRIHILNPKLRRINRIKTIHSSLAIENNTLSIEQVTAVLNGKHVLGTQEGIEEVKNAFKAYDILLDLNPYQIDSLLKAHKILMSNLLAESGQLRSSSVGIFDGRRLVHLAP